MPLIDPGPAATLPGALLTPFDELTRLEWDKASRRGRIAARRTNRVDDWYYSCHFLGDPVMPGCWGIDAVWQCLRYFGSWLGAPACKPLALDDVRFFGQIRPGDAAVEYAVDIVSVEESDGDWLITGRASVEVDGTQVYSIGNAQVGTAFWANPERRPAAPLCAPERRLCSALTYAEFRGRSEFSPAEVVAISQGTLVSDAPADFGLLPAGLMLELGRVDHLSWNEAAGEGRAVASLRNAAGAWYFAMNGGVKPAALSIDGVWQLLGLCLSWRGHLGTGRALGLERVDVFGEILPGDRSVVIEATVTDERVVPGSGDALLRADATVFAGGRPVLACSGASVGCYRRIRYSGYPRESALAFGGRLKLAEAS